MLENITILDMATLLPGPYCSMLLGDMGANVIKVEAVETGDHARSQPHIFNGVNRNKKSITLNLKDAKGREILHRLIKLADVFIEGFRPGVAKRLSVDYEKFSSINPGIIYCSISGYGQSGPYRDLPGHDLNYQAISGILSCFVDQDRKPIQPRLPIADMSSGLFAAIGILSSLLARKNSGKGKYLDVSMLDGLLSFLTVPFGRLFNNMENMEYDPGYSLFMTKDDKFIAIGIYFENWFWKNLCATIGLGDLAGIDFLERKKQKKEIEAKLIPIFRKKTRNKWVKILSSANVPVSPVKTLNEALQDEQILQRGIVREIEVPGKDTIKQIMCPIKFSNTTIRKINPPPALGENTMDILLQAGYSKDEIDDFKRKGII